MALKRKAEKMEMTPSSLISHSSSSSSSTSTDDFNYTFSFKRRKREGDQKVQHPEAREGKQETKIEASNQVKHEEEDDQKMEILYPWLQLKPLPESDSHHQLLFIDQNELKKYQELKAKQLLRLFMDTVPFWRKKIKVSTDKDSKYYDPSSMLLQWKRSLIQPYVTTLVSVVCSKFVDALEKQTRTKLNTDLTTVLVSPSKLLDVLSDKATILLVSSSPILLKHHQAMKEASLFDQTNIDGHAFNNMAFDVFFGEGQIFMMTQLKTMSDITLNFIETKLVKQYQEALIHKEELYGLYSMSQQYMTSGLMITILDKATSTVHALHFTGMDDTTNTYHVYYESHNDADDDNSAPHGNGVMTKFVYQERKHEKTCLEGYWTDDIIWDLPVHDISKLFDFWLMAEEYHQQHNMQDLFGIFLDFLGVQFEIPGYGLTIHFNAT